MATHDPSDPQGLEAHQRDRSERARLAAQQEAADLQWLMSSKRGRRIVWRQLDRAGVFRSSFNTNAMQMAFAEGGRNEGLRMTAQILSCCPDLYPVMLKEQTSDDQHVDDGSAQHKRR